MFYRIGFLCLFCISLFGAEHVYLKTPNISQQEIIGTNVGIRPFRKSGVRLEPELLKDKLIIHNYGYGGSGLTLSFGGAKEVLQILDDQKTSSKVVAVLGAGVIGLSVAYELLENGYEVHLYSDQWHPNLTSNVAAGIWTPLSIPRDLSKEKKSLHQRMLEVAEQRFLKSTGNHPEFSGVKTIWYYRLTTDTCQNTPDPTKGEAVVVHFDNGVIKNGQRICKLGIDGKLFIEDLYSKVKDKGATLHQKHFDSIEDLLNLKEIIIINCMSMGSRQLFDDQEFIPVRGQLVYFQPQDGIDYALSQAVPNSYYFVSIYPWNDRLILGGVYEFGEEALSINPDIINEIILNGQKCIFGEL